MPRKQSLGALLSKRRTLIQDEAHGAEIDEHTVTQSMHEAARNGHVHKVSQMRGPTASQIYDPRLANMH